MALGPAGGGCGGKRKCRPCRQENRSACQRNRWKRHESGSRSSSTSAGVDARPFRNGTRRRNRSLRCRRQRRRGRYYWTRATALRRVCHHGSICSVVADERLEECTTVFFYGTLVVFAISPKSREQYSSENGSKEKNTPTGRPIGLKTVDITTT